MYPQSAITVLINDFINKESTNTMNKREIQVIVDVLRFAKSNSLYENNTEAQMQHALICNDFALAFAKTNAYFDRVTFLRECGVPEYDHKTL